ncbi:MAG: hypothetical protein ACFFD6_00845 [Candidatus Thorarchaeota archaeon]
MENVISGLEYGNDWYQMLKQLADAESLVDVYLCTSAYGNPDDRETMVIETHGVRIIYVGEDFFVVGPRRPVHSSIIRMGWVSMIRVHQDSETQGVVSLLPEEDQNSEDDHLEESV